MDAHQNRRGKRVTVDTRAAVVSAPRMENSGESRLPEAGWVRCCSQCTRPTSQKILIITLRRGGESFVETVCRPCQKNQFQRFSPHVCFVVIPYHLKNPLYDVNVEIDRRIERLRQDVENTQGDPFRGSRKEVKEVRAKARNRRCFIA